MSATIATAIATPHDIVIAHILTGLFDLGIGIAVIFVAVLLYYYMNR